ncbi:hypothetical protein GCM10010309_39180 [Streptomyces violaceochromogenes]|nr:hypothetical protein GCM10010309_39180 [Streptomyces violaceochromogenes]
MRAGRGAFGLLLGLVGAQQVHELPGQPHGAPSGARLCVGRLRIGPLTLRAVAGFPAAGVAAPVGVTRPAATPPDHQDAPVKIDVRPPEAKRLALA